MSDTRAEEEEGGRANTHTESSRVLQFFIHKSGPLLSRHQQGMPIPADSSLPLFLTQIPKYNRGEIKRGMGQRAAFHSFFCTGGREHLYQQ